MSLCKRDGKDIIIFASKEDHAIPSKITLPEADVQPGLILPNGDINWNCPCLGGMATGPCGVEFREAFSCFHYSEAEPKGSDCFDAFNTMQQCMTKYPALYDRYNNKDDDDNQGEAGGMLGMGNVSSDVGGSANTTDSVQDKLSADSEAVTRK